MLFVWSPVPSPVLLLAPEAPFLLAMSALSAWSCAMTSAFSERRAATSDRSCSTADPSAGDAGDGAILEGSISAVLEASVLIVEGDGGAWHALRGTYYDPCLSSPATPHAPAKFAH